MRSIEMPRRSHQTESLDRPNRLLPLGKGNTVVGTNRLRQTAIPKQPLEGRDGQLFAGRLQGLAQQQVTGGMVGDGQRIAVPAVAEFELTLVIGAPQFVGCHAGGKWGAAGAMARAADGFNQAVPMQDSMDRALGRDARNGIVEAAQQQLADLASAPVRLLALEGDDQFLDLMR